MPDPTPPVPASNVTPYDLVPETEETSVPSCDGLLVGDRRRTVALYLAKVGPSLQRRHGRAPSYSPQQVRDEVMQAGLSVDYVCWAYLLYCTPSDFAAIHAATGELCDFDAMRAAVSECFFGGVASFDALELATALAAGGGAELAAGAFSWLTELDFGGLIDV